MPMPYNKDPKTPVQHEAHLDGTINYLNQDLAQQVERAGLDNTLQHWIEDLKDQNMPAFHPLIKDLQALKAHFNTDNPSIDVIAPLLSSLAKTTKEVARLSQHPNVQSRIKHLAEALEGASAKVKNNLQEDNFKNDL